MSTPQPSSSPAIRVANLTVAYQREGRFDPPAVDEVSFSVRPGEALGLVGESGCGKTSCAMALMRLLPPQQARIEGSVQAHDADVLKLSRSRLTQARGELISMIFQDPMTSLDPSFTIGFQVSAPLRQRKKLSRTAAAEAAAALLSEVGIADPARVCRSYPHQLSGGMRQRVMIALAISMSPAVLIADEPTTALDVTVQEQILELLSRLRRERSMAMLLITHDLAVVAETCERVAVMYNGQIVETGDTAAVLHDPQHPYTRGLIDSIPSRETKAGRLPVIAGRVPDVWDRPTGCRFSDRCSHVFDRCQEEPPLARVDGPDREVKCWLPQLTEAVR